MKNLKKKTAILLLSAMLLSTLASCQKADSGDSSASDPGSSGSVETEPARLYADDIPDDVKFDGAAVKMMWWLENAEFTEEMTGEVVNDAMYERDMSVESRLNVDIQHIGESYTWGTKDEYLGKIRSSAMADDGVYDIASGQYATLPSLIADGVFTDLRSLNYLDFSKPYWVQQLVEETSINGRLYLATGDLSTQTIKQVWCIFYNETMRNNLGLQNPVELVQAGTWTKDAMNTMITDVYQDTDGDQNKSAGDTFGFVVENANFTFPFINAFDLKITTMNKEGYPELTFNDEKVFDAFEYTHNWLQTNPDVIYGELGGLLANPGDAFPSGRALFGVNQFSAATKYSEMEDEFRVLPMPKWDESQKKYQTWIGESNTLIGITVTASDMDATAAVMEMMAAESYRLVSPAIYEINLKTRYSADSEMAQMFDLIREGVVFNFGLAYGYAMNELNTFWKLQFSSSTNNFASNWAANEGSYKAAIDDFYLRVSDLP